MIRRPPRSTLDRSSAASDVYKRQLCKLEDINLLSGPGRGVILIKLNKDDDRVLGFMASRGDRDLMTVETTRGAEQTISTTKYEVTGRVVIVHIATQSTAHHPHATLVP